MDSVRARISFGDNFSELATIHRRCLILVPRNECTTVNALKEYIRIKFSIDQQLNFGLSIDGYVLPEWESSQIIRENDTLCIFATDESSALPVLRNKRKKKRKSEDGSNRQIEPEAKKAKKSKRKKTKEPEKENDKKKKKHKHKTSSVLKKVHEVEELSIKQQERMQGDVDTDQTFPANVNSTIATEQQLVAEDDVENVVTMNGADVDAVRDQVEENRKKIDIDESGRLQEGGKEVNNLKNGDASQNNSLLSRNERMVAGLHETINNKDEITPLKKKRRRKRRKKSKSNIAVKSSGSQEQRPVSPHESTDGNNVQEGLGVSSSQSIRETLIIDKEHSSGHIVFDSDDDDDVENQSKKVEIQDESIKNGRVTDLLTSHLEQNGEVENDNSEVQGPGLAPTVTGEEAQQEKQFHKQVPKTYEAYQPLNGPPRNGDIIAFKTLELSSLYTPEVSEFKEGVVTKFDHKTQQVDIQLTTVPFTKPAAGEDQRDGRFEMEMDEDWTTDRQQEQATALISTHLSSLMDLKLIS